MVHAKEHWRYHVSVATVQRGWSRRSFQARRSTFQPPDSRQALDGDYSQLPFFLQMAEGKVKGYFVFGQNPTAGAPNAALHRKGLRVLEWLVTLDWFETETATFWKNDPKGPDPSQIKTEVFLIPAASIAAKEGSYTNTQRLIQWHDKAVDPEADCRSDLWFVWNLGRRLKQLYSGSRLPQDQAIQALTWDYAHDRHPHLPELTDRDPNR